MGFGPVHSPRTSSANSYTLGTKKTRSWKVREWKLRNQATNRRNGFPSLTTPSFLSHVFIFCICPAFSLSAAVSAPAARCIAQAAFSSRSLRMAFLPSVVAHSRPVFQTLFGSSLLLYIFYAVLVTRFLVVLNNTKLYTSAVFAVRSKR